MKVFICALVALCLLTVTIVWFCAEADDICDMLLQKADKLNGYITEEDKENAEKLLAEIQKLWEEKTPLFMAFSEHSSIHAVSECLFDIKNRLAYDDFASAFSSLSSFKQKIACISADTMPTLINIL